MILRRTLLATAVAALSLTLPLPLAADHTATLHIHDAYARAMGGVGKSGAVFLEIMNAGTADDRLIAAKSDAAEKVELHTHKEDANGVMQMLEVPEGFAVPAGGSHLLARGGDHVMLLGLTRALAPGDKVSLTLVFEKAGEVTLEVPLDNDRKGPMAGAGMEDGMMQGHKHGG